MNPRLFNVSDWETFQGSFRLEFEDANVDITLVSEGVSAFVEQDGRSVLVFNGAGRHDLRLRAGGPFGFRIEAPDNLVYTSVMRLGDRAFRQVGSESYTRFVDMRDPPISPEIQAVIDRMNRNAIAREQAMLRAFGRHSRSD